MARRYRNPSLPTRPVDPGSATHQPLPSRQDPHFAGPKLNHADDTSSTGLHAGPRADITSFAGARSERRAWRPPSSRTAAHQPPVAARPHGGGAAAILRGLVVLAFAAMAAAPAGAQTVGTLVSNADEGGIGSPRNYAAQSFRTGGQAGGYEVTGDPDFRGAERKPTYGAPPEDPGRRRRGAGRSGGDVFEPLPLLNTDEAIFSAPKRHDARMRTRPTG